MCMTIYLLADRPLPVPVEATVYPGLRLHPIEEDGQVTTLAGIRKIAPAAFAYGVTPDGYCGCYFQHQTPEAFREHMAERAADLDGVYADTPEHAEAMWRCQTDAVQSLGRYLADHADAARAVYVVWEHHAGQREPIRAAVSPSYFNAPGFASLPEDLLLTIVPDSETQPWDPAAPRTHEWLSCSGTE